MEQYIDAPRIANSILIDTQRKDTILLVEGINDNLFFEKFVDNRHCEIKIAFGYQNINDVIDILKQSGQKVNAIGILDQDFLGLEKALPITPNVFFVDAHDLELVAFNTKAFELVFINFGNKARIDKLEAERGKKLREIFLEMACCLGLLKFINFKYKLGLSFKPSSKDSPKMKFDFYDSANFKFIGYEKLIDTVYNFSAGKSNPAISRPDCLLLLKKYISNSYDQNLLANGHDICRLISLSLRKHTGAMGSKAPMDDEIEQRLVLAYDSADFMVTKLYSEIKKYESGSSYAVLSI